MIINKIRPRKLAGKNASKRDTYEKMERYITDKQMFSIFFNLRDDKKFIRFNKNK